MNTKISTDDLFNIIRKKDDISDFFHDAEKQLLDSDLCEYLNKIIDKKQLKRSFVFEKTCMTKSYFYKLFNGEKQNPSRDILIQLCFAFSFDLDETQEFLKHTGAGVLYPRNQRDSIIIFCIQRQLPIIDCNQLLYENDMNILE